MQGIMPIICLISETVTDGPTLLLITNRKSHKLYQMTMDELG